MDRSEQRQADDFFASLMGEDFGGSSESSGDFFDSFGQPPRRRHRARRRQRAFESLGGSRSSQRPLSHYEQWVANSIASDAERRPAPLGGAWVRARLLGPNKPGALTIAAQELRRLDGQRQGQGGTNLRVDTGQTEVLRRASTTLLPQLERLDTTVAQNASCSQTFATTADLAARKAHWRRQIDGLATSNQAVLIAWITGKQSFSGNSVVQAATDEAKAQIDCMRAAINTARASQSLADPKTRSPTRDFESQLCIWLWKYFFKATRSGMSPPCSSSAGATWEFGSMRQDNVARCQAALPASSSQFSVGAEWKPTGSGARTTAHRDCWNNHLSGAQREQEILQTSSAPGISRHHWGTDVDLGSVSGSDWLSGTHLALYRWLQANAMAFGMVQTYTPDRPGYTASSPRTGYNGYIEERWHWSYYPVAQALLEWASEATHRTAIQTALTAAWADVGTNRRYRSTRSTLSWGSSTNPFSHIATVWQDFFFNVNRFVTPPVI